MSAVNVVVKVKLFIYIHFHWIYLKCGCGFVMLLRQCWIDSPCKYPSTSYLLQRYFLSEACVVCFSEQIAISNFYRHVKDKSVQAYFRCFFYISVWGIWCFFGRTLTLKLYIIWQINCCAIYWYFKNINLYFYKLLVVLTYYWSLKVASIKLLSHCKVIFAYLVARPGYCTELLQTEF